MANPAELIDETIETADGIAPDDADIDPRRVRLLRFLQQLYSYIHNYHEWEWTFAETAFNVASGKNYAWFSDTEVSPGVIETGVIPDFMEFGKNGHLFQGQTRLKERTRYIVSRARLAVGGSGSGYAPYIFGIWGGALQFPYAMTAQTAFTAYHRVKPERLADDDTELLMPDKYRDVLMAGMMWKAMESKHDIRETFANQFNEMLSQMSALESPVKTARRYAPLALKGVW